MTFATSDKQIIYFCYWKNWIYIRYDLYIYIYLNVIYINDISSGPKTAVPRFNFAITSLNAHRF